MLIVGLKGNLWSEASEWAHDVLSSDGTIHRLPWRAVDCRLFNAALAAGVPEPCFKSEVATSVPHDSTIEPGQFVRHPHQPDWGLGQVQSVIDDRITVNFEHAGKVLVNSRIISLTVLHGEFGGHP